MCRRLHWLRWLQAERRSILLSAIGRKVGFRYLRAKKSSSFLSIITMISIGGVGVGVLTMIITLSVMAGFERELKSRLFAAETHVLVESDQGFFKNDPKLISEIESASPKIQKTYPVLQTEVILRTGQKVTGAVFKGVGAQQLQWLEEHVGERAPKDLPSDTPTSRLYVGQEMAYDLGLIPGDVVTIVSPVESEGPFGAVPRVKKFLVEGIYKTGVPEQELHVVFAPSADVESFLKQSDVLSQIEVKVSSLEDAPKVSGILKKKLGASFLIRPWQELNAHLFQSLRLERTAMFCILIFIVIVATFNIVSTLTMMVIEKKRSLSILRAMGATRKQVASIFLWEGFAIGLVGVAGGSLVAFSICWALGHYPVIQLPDFFYDRSLPVIVDPAVVGTIVGVALLIVMFGAIWPAMKAADLPPIQGIREG